MKTSPSLKTNDIARNVATEGFREHMVAGLKHGLINFHYQPGKWKKQRIYDKDGKSWHMGPKKFIKNEHYPNGVYYSFPAWFVLLIGVPALAKLLGGLNIGGIFDWIPGIGEGAWYPGKHAVESLQEWGGVRQETDIEITKEDRHEYYDWFISQGYTDVPDAYRIYFNNDDYQKYRKKHDPNYT